MNARGPSGRPRLCYERRLAGSTPSAVFGRQPSLATPVQPSMKQSFLTATESTTCEAIRSTSTLIDSAQSALQHSGPEPDSMHTVCILYAYCRRGNLV